MATKLTYEELELRVKELKKESVERKRIEERLEEREQTLQALLNAPTETAILVDLEGTTLAINEIAAKRVGKNLDELIGLGLFEYLPHDVAASRKAKGDEVVCSGKPVRFQDERAGRIYDNNIYPVFDAEEKVRALAIYARDITETKRAEEALRESEDRYKSLFKNNHSVMLLVDPKSADIVDANPAATSFYGWSYEELTRKKITNINTLTEEQVFQEMKRAKTEQNRTFYFKHRLASEKIRDVEVYSGPIKVYGRELLYSIIHDITKRKQAELSLIERRKELENKTHELEEVNAALRVLLKQREEDKKEFEEKVIANVKKLVFPYVEKLNSSRLHDRQVVYLDIIKSNLENIIAPFLHHISSKYSDLTPMEIQVAGFVKDGKTTKEIAELLNSSTGAIDFHRNNLRKKLGLRNTKTNLRSFLLSLP